MCSLQVAFVLLCVCVQNLFRPQHLEAMLLVLACVSLLWGVGGQKPCKSRMFGCRGGAFKSYCAGAGQGPNTNLPNLVSFFSKMFLAAKICLECRISLYISAHSSEFSPKFSNVFVFGALTNLPEIVFGWFWLGFALLGLVGVCSGGWCSYFLLPIFMIDGGEVCARTTTRSKT